MRLPLQEVDFADILKRYSVQIFSQWFRGPLEFSKESSIALDSASIHTNHRPVHM